MSVGVKWKAWQPLPFEEEERFSEPEKLIILAAGPGGMISKKQNPNLPCSVEEIAKYHIEAYNAGASIVHIHTRDEDCLPSSDPALYRKIVGLIKSECPDVIIDFCFAHPLEEDTVEARIKPLCEMGLPVEIGTMSAGSMNISGTVVYINREAYIKASVKYLVEKGIKPAITIYNLKQMADVEKCIVKPGLVDKPFFNLSLGLFGEPARRENLRSFVQNLPPNANWVCESAGRNWLPVAVEAIMLGGHVRAGMEDGIYMYPHRDDLIKSSAEAVGKIVKIAKELGREIAKPQEARKILGLTSK